MVSMLFVHSMIKNKTSMIFDILRPLRCFSWIVYHIFTDHWSLFCLYYATYEQYCSPYALTLVFFSFPALVPQWLAVSNFFLFVGKKFLFAVSKSFSFVLLQERNGYITFRISMPVPQSNVRILFRRALLHLSILKVKIFLCWEL